MFLCCKRQVAQSVRFDEQTFGGFHLYDIDFAFRAHLAGYRLSVCNDLYMIHQSVGRWDDAWDQDHERFVQKHRARIGSGPRRPSRWGAVAVATRQEVQEVMTPAHWPAEIQD